MHKNEVVSTSNQKLEDAWLRDLFALYHPDTHWSSIEKIVCEHHEGRPCKVTQRIPGGFNYCFKLEFDDGVQWILRFPVPGCTMYPHQKVQDEVAVMDLLNSQTNIPLPEVIACGEAKIGSTKLGPYIVMEFVQGSSLDDLILTEEGKIRPDVKDEMLRKIYAQMARILLQLSQLRFNKIGALNINTQGSDITRSILRGPLTLKSNEIERLAGVKSNTILRNSFSSSEEYLDALVEQSLCHLSENPLASVSYEEACDEYNALFALRESISRFVATSTEDSFLLFNDDIRFGNMIVDDKYEIVAIIDWEFCYAAPSTFLKCPPNWLIGEEPFEWEDSQNYEAHLLTFLELLEQEELAAGFDNDFSACMRKYWGDGTFWFNMAVLESLPLAKVMKHCWHLFPNRPLHSDMEEFARRKMEQRREFKAIHPELE